MPICLRKTLSGVLNMSVLRHVAQRLFGHLVLSRREHETICIGDDIQVEVLRISGGEARIGIRAPRDVRVLRGELTTRQ